MLTKHLPGHLILRWGWKSIIGKRTEIPNCAVDLGQLLPSAKERLLCAPPSSIGVFSILEVIIVHFVFNHGHVHGLIADLLQLEGVLVLRVRDLLFGVWPPAGDIDYGRQEVLL